MSNKKFIVVAMLVLTAAGLGAQGTATLVRAAESSSPAGASGETKIVGQVLDIRQTPVANVTVRLRSLISGTVQEVSSDSNGEYQFTIADPGTYVVEMVMPDGSVLALSNAATVGRSETLQTVVQLPGRWNGTRMATQKSAMSFFGMSAATTMTAQTVRMALEQRVRPVDSGEPVSPFRP